MSDLDDAMAVLGQVVEVGHTPQEVALGNAVAQHIATRPPAARAEPDPEILETLRSLGQVEVPEMRLSPLTIHVEFNELHERLGEPEVWTVLGKLNDLFGGT